MANETTFHSHSTSLVQNIKTCVLSVKLHKYDVFHGYWLWLVVEKDVNNGLFLCVSLILSYKCCSQEF